MESGTTQTVAAYEEVRQNAQAGSARAQYALSEIEFKRGNKGEALRWLQKAVEKNFSNACYTMATFQIAGISVPYDAIGARSNVTQAAAQGHADAQLLLSQMARSGLGGEKSQKLANSILFGLAQAGHPVALCGVAMLVYIRNRESDAVDKLLERAAIGGSHIAAYIQAEKRRDAATAGDLAARDERIKYLFISARAGNGLAQAELTEHDKLVVQEILSRASFSPAVDSEVDLKYVEEILDQEVEYSFDQPEILSKEHPIAIYRRFLTPLECSYMKAAAAPSIQPSSTINPLTGELIKNEIRTSSSSNFDPMSRDCFIFAVDERIAAATGTDVEQGEPLNVLYYRIGEEYKFHYDHLPEEGEDPGALQSEGGQRKYTFLISMNEDYTGGETIFPKLELMYRGQLGDALMFQNLDSRGRPNNRMLHAGMPVKRGYKWVASKWIREGEYRLGAPARAAT